MSASGRGESAQSGGPSAQPDWHADYLYFGNPLLRWVERAVWLIRFTLQCIGPIVWDEYRYPDGIRPFKQPQPNGPLAGVDLGIGWLARLISSFSTRWPTVHPISVFLIWYCLQQGADGFPAAIWILLEETADTARPCVPAEILTLTHTPMSWNRRESQASWISPLSRQLGDDERWVCLPLE